MTDRPAPDAPPTAAALLPHGTPRPHWKTPALERIGTIRDVRNGSDAGAGTANPAGRLC